MKTRFFILLIFVFSLLTETPGQNQIFRSYTVSDGLSNNAIRKIYQDSRGFIWICTWEGLNKFEGHKFTRFTTSNGLPHSMVNGVFETSPGVMMVLMNDGNRTFIQDGRKISQSQKTTFIINQLLYDTEKGLLGVSDWYGLLKIDSSRISRAAGNDSYSLYDIIKWRDHYICIGDPASVSIYDNDLKLKGNSEGFNQYPHCIYKNKNDQVLVGTETGLRLMDLTDLKKPVLNKAIAPFDHPVLLSNPIMAIYQDHLGNSWFGTYSGLVKVSPAGVTKIYTEKDGLPGNRITCITEDKEQNLWVGTYSGLAKLSYQSVDIVAPSSGTYYNGPLNSVSVLSPTELAIISRHALYNYNTKLDQFRELLKFTSSNPGVMISGKQPFSIIYNDSVYTWNENTKYMEPRLSFKNDFFFSAAQYGDMICGSFIGITLRFGNGEIIRILDSLRIDKVIWDKQGRILAGTWDQSLKRITLDPQKNKVIKIEDFSKIGSVDFVRSIHQDSKGNIWVGTRYKGITVLTEIEEGKFTTRQFDQSNGLLSDWIHSITEAPDGNMWIGSLSGISKIIISDQSFRIFNFSRAVNFYSTVNSLVTADQGNFWGTSDNGLFSFKDLQLENTPPLPVYFTDIRLGNADSNYVSREPGEKTRLRYNQNYLRFEFASPGFLNEKDLHYSYRLRGSRDTSWTLPSNRYAVEYASLSPGQYVFEVKMIGWNGDHGPVTMFTFTINRPFWQSWWFYLGVAALVIITAFSIIRYRTKQIIKLQKVRNSIATDLHDDIGSSLTNISILSQLSLDSLERKEETKKFISRIRDEVQSSNQALDDIIWSVNSQNDTLDETLARMRRYVGDLFDNSSTKYHLDLAANGSDQKLNMEQRRDLFLIFKEALNNIHKHAGAGNAWIRVSVSQHVITLSVTDDGTGFDNSLQTHRNGLKNMRTRVNKWKGQFVVNRGETGGTKINITLPVAAN